MMVEEFDRCAKYDTSRTTSSTRRRASPSTRAPVLDQVRAATGGGGDPRRKAPRAPVLTRPFYHLQVPSLRRVRARPLVPRAPRVQGSGFRVQGLGFRV